MDKNSTILVTGATGFLGRNLVQHLMSQGYERIVGTGRHFPYQNPQNAYADISEHRPDYVFHLAAHVSGLGGHLENKSVGYVQNVLINTAFIEWCAHFKVKKILGMGTGAVYPPAAEPMKENQIWHGAPHNSEYGYAQAKRGMLAQLECTGIPYVFPVCANLYGPHDKFNRETGHVIPSLIRKFYEDELPMAWGTGSAKRDFLHVHDACRALELLMLKEEGPVNLASGEVAPISRIMDILGKHTGKGYSYNPQMPDGQLVRQYDISKLKALGFAPQHNLETGLRETYDWFAEQQKVLTAA